MGIPKFFRFMSERYPLISQLIEENKIPEFDNLYLDMNGIIHNCSHPNDEDASFRISETQIFLAIFAYIEHLFYKIKPKNVFFLAIDGVAPRAKMNQQRSRRFRTAKEAEETRQKAERRGEVLPEEEAFDSNCITPGTVFMAKLSDQLRYFISKKITEDADWRNVQVILSGHDVPGEGEHKIMEYIRLCKAQSGYHPNVRHCLYGLDADLVMLGLLSHDPHFCLLREEVQFGPARKRNKGGLDSQNFFLLHLSLFREYLDMEFQDLRSSLPFPYEFEKILDDFILLNLFVGNDFLPHLPGLHINEGALDLLFNIYKQILPIAGGYLNESGVLRTDRLQLVLVELTKFEMEHFEKEYSDVNLNKATPKKPTRTGDHAKAKGKLVLTKPQRRLLDQIHAFIMAHRHDAAGSAKEMYLPADLPAKDRRFLEDLTSNLKLRVSFNKYDPSTDRPAISLAFPEIEESDESEESFQSEIDNDDDQEDQEVTSENAKQTKDSTLEERKPSQHRVSEADVAVDRVLNRYLKAKVDDLADADWDPDEEHQRKLEQKMTEWKKNYYKEKLEIDYDDKKDMAMIAYRYVEGLQWVLHYYYDGVASWGWFYDYHYAPKISDLKDVGEMSFTYDLGKPFRPFDQLMGVLPALSGKLIPPALRDLMVDPNSPISDFYPLDFETDLNGKKQDWEAVVKVPFIDEKRLLEALDKREIHLSEDEKLRNSVGLTKQFIYDEEEHFYPSSLPGVFPDIVHCHSKAEEFNLPTLKGVHLVKGLTDGVQLGARMFAGFPSIKTLPHYARLGHHGVNIFQSESKGVSVVVTVENTYQDSKTESIAQAMIGNRVFINWPFLTEALVVGVSDHLFKYEMGMVGRTRKVVANPHQPENLHDFHRKAERIGSHYSKRFGVLIGGVDVLVHARPLKGLRRLDDGAFVKDYQEESKKEVDLALQVTVTNVIEEDSRYLESPAKPISEEYPDKSKVFFLGQDAYGTPASVVGSTESSLAIEVVFFPNQAKENAVLRQVVEARAQQRYLPSYVVAKKCGMSSLALSRLTSSLLLQWNDQKVNIGLNLKFEGKGQKVLGFSRKSANGWEFSEKAIQLVEEYMQLFPEVIGCINKPNVDFTRASQIWPEDQAEERVVALKQWIKAKGVRELETVSLFAEQLSKETVAQIEGYTSKLVAMRSANGPDNVKRVFIKGIPRTALLKPSHAPFRLQGQKFELGDRVILVQDSGNVPLSARGVVIGINSNSIDVVFDVPFLSGSTLDGRCSPYRGSTLPFSSVLNLSQPQFMCAGADGVGATSASVGDALERTLGPVGAEGFGNGNQRGGNAGRGRWDSATSSGSYRPPNAFTPNPAAQRGGRGGGANAAGVQILARPTQRYPAVQGAVPFSGVASGQHRPNRDAVVATENQETIHPLMAALNINGGRGGAARGGHRGGFRGGLRGGRPGMPAIRPETHNLPQNGHESHSGNANTNTVVPEHNPFAILMRPRVPVPTTTETGATASAVDDSTVPPPPPSIPVTPAINGGRGRGRGHPPTRGGSGRGGPPNCGGRGGRGRGGFVPRPPQPSSGHPNES